MYIRLVASTAEENNRILCKDLQQKTKRNIQSLDTSLFNTQVENGYLGAKTGNIYFRAPSK
jgi:hypothetical protein